MNQVQRRTAIFDIYQEILNE